MSSAEIIPLAYNIRQFCKLVGISHTCFYDIPLDQRPPVRSIGARRLITADDARTWLARLPITGERIIPPPPPPGGVANGQ